MAADSGKITEFRVGTTINQFIGAQEHRHAHATGALSYVLMEIAVACKLIASKIQRAGISDILGKASSSNTTGDVQAKLDVQSNIVMSERLLATRYVAAFISEEEEHIILPTDPAALARGRYIVASDPLDGSSNIDCNVPVGTIFGVWDRVTPRGTPVDPAVDAHQPGRAQLASGYVLYGSSVMMVITLGPGSGVHGFTLDPAIGEFVLSHENMRYPDKVKNYSVNEGNSALWGPGLLEYIAWCKTEDKATARPYAARYVGSLISDFHRNLLYGGIYLYPADRKNKDGKLRLMYEAAPLALISAEAGGKASSGFADILDIVPVSLHHKVPLFIGNGPEVDRAVSYVARDIAAAASSK